MCSPSFAQHFEHFHVQGGSQAALAPAALWAVPAAELGLVELCIPSFPGPGVILLHLSPNKALLGSRAASEMQEMRIQALQGGLEAVPGLLISR